MCNNYSSGIKHLAFFLVWMVLHFNLVYGQEIKPRYNAQEIIVTASRIPIGLEETGRSVEVITKEELNALPVQQLQDVLSYVEGVQLSHRGPLGSQADVRIRGGSFEQTLILIDGNKVSDPQTGHHNLNLPLNVQDIERVEILRGAGSRIYGPNAFGGVINFITKKKVDSAISTSLSGGEHGYYSAGVSLAMPFKGTHHQLSLNKQGSDGYRFNTDFKNQTIFYGFNNEMQNGELNAQLSFIDKEFGANQFYSDSFPEQWENTQTSYLAIGGSQYLGNQSEHQLSAKLHWRHNEDEFLLKRSDPDFYRNKHKTNVWGGTLGWQADYQQAKSSLTFDFGLEDINSTNLGKRVRRFAGMIAEQHFSINKVFRITPGISFYSYSEWKPQIQPAIDVVFNVNPQLDFFGSVGRAFRIPTFTELYYEDRANMANANLKPEEAWAYELGFRYRKIGWKFESSMFYRDAQNVIDWVKPPNEDLWQAQNISSVETFGIESKFSFHSEWLSNLTIQNLELSYAFLNSGRDLNGLDSRYVFQYLKHQVQLQITQAWSNKLNQFWALRYQDPKTNESHFVLDTKISYDLYFEKVRFPIYVEISNVFNTNYQEVKPIPMPGRWIIVGIQPSF